MRPLAPALLAAVAALAACKERTEPPPSSGAPASHRLTPFTLRDLALATAVDARAARLSLAGADVEAALAATGARERGRAKELLTALGVARAELEQAIGAVANPADRTLAAALGARAAAYAQELAAAATGAPAGAAGAARILLGDAISAYRQARAAWRVDAPAPEGPERELAEARRELERAESAFAAQGRLAARDGATVAAERARRAAQRLPPATRDAAVRWVAAQEQVLAAAAALVGAPDRDRARAARAYHLAKAEALAALADHFAALSAR
jgi:hypothetical protein